MLPDFLIPVNTWTDLYALTGVAQGTALKVTLKSRNDAYAWEGTAAPPSTPDIRHGEPFEYRQSVRNTDLTTGLWFLAWSTIHLLAP